MSAVDLDGHILKVMSVTGLCEPTLFQFDTMLLYVIERSCVWLKSLAAQQQWTLV